MRRLTIIALLWLFVQDLVFGRGSSSISQLPKFNGSDLIDMTKFSDLSLPKDGRLGRDDVQNIIRKLLSIDYLDLPPSLLKPYCLRIEPITKRDKGFFSGQIFTIKYHVSCLSSEYYSDEEYLPLYVLKEATNGQREAKNFSKINKSTLLQERMSTRKLILSPFFPKEQELPIITFSELNFVIPTHDKVRYFSLLQMAQGKSLKHHLRDLGRALRKKNRREALTKATDMFYRIGITSGKFHQKYSVVSEEQQNLLPLSFAHGDFQAANIFFDFDSNNVYYIDNETMAFSIDKPSLGISDLVDLYVLHSSKTIAHTFCPSLLVHHNFDISDDIWHTLWRSLLRGYLESFSHIKEPSQKARLFIEVRDTFINRHDFIRSPHKIWDQRRLKRIDFQKKRKKIIDRELTRLFQGLAEDYFGAQSTDLT